MPRKPKTPAPRIAHANPFGEVGADLELVDSSDSSLLDVLDNLLNNGVVLQGELVMGLANIDLIYARVSLLLCAADRLEEFRGESRIPSHATEGRPPPLFARASAPRWLAEPVIADAAAPVCRDPSW